METLTSILVRRATSEDDRPFLRIDDGPWRSCAEVDGAAEVVATGLAALGVSPGDRVLVLSELRSELIDLQFACARLGAVFVPVNSYLHGEFLRHQLLDSGAVVAVSDAAGDGVLAEVLVGSEVGVHLHLDPDVDGRASTVDGVRDIPFAELSSLGGSYDGHDDASATFTILYTSGTTGMPKGCMLSQGYYVRSARSLASYGWCRPDDRLFNAFPYFHAGFQLVGLASSLVNGAQMSVRTSFSASAFMRQAREVDATVINGVGAMAMAVLAQPSHLEESSSHRLRLATFVPMHPDSQAEFEERFGVPVSTQCYGSTEVTPLTMQSLDDGPGVIDRSRSGRGITDLEVAILRPDGSRCPAGEVGEIAVRPNHPHAMFNGYWRNPEATLKTWRGLWHHTGDLGELDEQGRLRLVDRLNDSVRRRGENISCLQVELALGRHPDVEQVAVVGLPGSLGEDELKAVFAGPGLEGLSAGDWFEFLRGALPYYAIPRYIALRDALPVTITGRVQKQVLRDAGTDDVAYDLEALGYEVSRDDRRQHTS